MKMQWEKLPERLQSESLKCLMCNVMRAHIKKEGATAALAHCSVYMTQALVTEDDEAFKDVKSLLDGVHKVLERRTIPEDIISFLGTHGEYITDRVREVLDRAKECPEFKEHSQ